MKLAAAAAALLLVAGWFLYLPASNGAFLFDDLPHLDSLKDIDDQRSATEFVFSGTAGPLGRPIALASFLAQRKAIEEGPGPFLKFNIALHLFNTIILVWMVYLLSRYGRLKQTRAMWIAIAAAAIWMLMPLLASSTLMVIQRMTTLSATFVLLGIVAYLSARKHLDSNENIALTGMSVALVFGTLLAVFTKENGALLPTFVLVLELTLLQRPRALSRNTWRAWCGIFLWLPTVLILTYIVTRVPYSEVVVLKRDFTGWERLLTQSRILWEYLFNAFIPRPGVYGPFHDGYPVARTIFNPLTFAALAGWIVVLALAVLWRRRYPLFAFTALWFLAGHMLESTVVPLELYFEHRNYLPIIGPVYALCTAAFLLPDSRKKLAYIGIPLYVAANATVLLGLTTLWGNPPLAAHYWQQKFPDSIRAKTTAASHQLSEDWAERTLNMLNRVSEERPGAGYLKIQELDLACAVAPQQNHRETVVELRHNLRSVDFTHAAGTMLSNLISTAHRVDCNGVDSDTLRSIVNAILKNPRYIQDPLYNQIHHKLLARLARLDGNYGEAIKHLRRAAEYVSTADINLMIVTTFIDAGQFQSAHQHIAEARNNAPIHPLKRYVWHSQLDGLALYVDEIEGQAPVGR